MADQVYSKKNLYKSAPVVTIDGVTLKSSNYTVTYYKDAAMTDQITSKNKVELGAEETSATIYVKIVGKGNYKPVNSETDYVTATYQVRKSTDKVNMSKTKVIFRDEAGKQLTKAEYTGNVLEPTVIVQEKIGKKWVDVEDMSQFTITYINNVNKGTAKVVVTANGDRFVGSKTATFKVVSYNLKSLADIFKNLFQ